MHTRLPLHILIALALILLGAIFLLYIHNQQTLSFQLTEVLKRNNISEEVSIDGAVLEIQHGDVLRSGKRIRDFSKKIEAMQIAILLTEAKHAPLLGIPGTDPTTLKADVADLEKVQGNLAAAQDTESEQKYVAEALYPIAYLRELAALEERRLFFIEARTPEAAHAYETQLFQTIQTGIRDSAMFSDAAQSILEPEKAGQKVYSLSGAVSKESVLNTAKTVTKRMQETLEQAELRRICRSRAHASCVSHPISFPLMNSSAEQAATLPQSPVRDEVYEFFLSVLRSLFPHAPESLVRDAMQVELANSVCVRELNGPHYYMLSLKNELNPHDTPHFTSDIFFIPTEGSGGTAIAYLRKEKDISSVIVRPLSFYSCPEAQYDIGTIVALKHVMNLANTYPMIAQAERGALLATPPVIKETRARQYVAAALEELRGAEATNKTALRSFEELKLMLQTRTAGFDILIKKIVEVVGARAQQKQVGLPFDASAYVFFYTHHALPSLFLTHHPGTGETPVRIAASSERGLQEFLASHLQYSKFRTTRDLESFLEDTVGLRNVDTGTDHLIPREEDSRN